MNTQSPLKLDLLGPSECIDKMAQQSGVNNALGTLIGYVGAEAATHDVFERLLWPQRFYNGISLRKGLKMALLLPMGGPLHKAALSTLDRIRANGLFKGRNLGDMLGSPFYDDTNIKYTIHDCLGIDKPEEEYVRNGLWIRAIASLPIPQVASPKRSVESGLAEHNKSRHQPTRAINRVSHLRLSIPDHRPCPSEIIGSETGDPTATTYLALFVTELTGIAIGIVSIAVWRSWFALFWFVPVSLKLTSAYFSVPRGRLELPALSPPSETPTPSHSGRSSPMAEKTALLPPVLKKFEIHDVKHGFLLIEGDENIILQFFRHYGHPIRSRRCEFVQFAMIIAFAFLFPVELLCSILWMPFGLQYTWLAYQLYASLAMYIYRFTDGHALGTTGQRIAERFEENGAKEQKQIAYFGGEGSVLMAELEVTYHNRVKDGRSHLQTLLLGGKKGTIERSSSQASSSSSSTAISSLDRSMGFLTPTGTSTSCRCTDRK